MTEALPRVSVCIPTHRRPDYLRQAIASVRAGSEQNFEIVISDDAGELESRRVADSFQDARIRYLPFNGDGIAANWSNALKQARAPYAFKLDDDDEIEPAFLTRCCDFLDAHPAAAVVFTGFTYLHPDKAPRAQIDSVYWNGCDAVAGLDYARDILLNRAYPLNHKSAGVFRKAAAERAKFFDVVTVDVIFSAALAASGEVGYIPEALFRYHVRDAKHEGMEQRPLRMLLESVRQFFELDAVREQPEWRAMKDEAIQCMVKGAAVRYVANSFQTQGWNGGWEMTRFVTSLEPSLRSSAFFWASVGLVALLPRRAYDWVLDTYIRADWVKRLANCFMRA